MYPVSCKTLLFAGTDVWAEVFLQSENKWVCVDCVRGKINQPETMEDAATKPISYILSVDNGERLI